MVTIKDVAQRAGVSTATVSRVLAGVGASPTTRDRVLTATRELSFRPNGVARSLRSTGTRTVGLVVSDLLNPYFTELARAVEDTARAAGFAVIIGNADESPSQQDHYVRILLERQVDGLIVVPTVETSPLLREAAATGHRLVLVDRSAEDVDAPLVSADGAPAIEELVAHLVATGRRTLAVIAGPEHAGSSRERLVAFRVAAERLGLEVPEEGVVHGDFRSASGAAAMAGLLDGPRRPDAVLVSNGAMGLGAVSVLQERAASLRVPDDLAVAVFDDMPFFQLLRPTLTAIEQPTTEVGRLAMEMLLAQIAGEPAADVRLSCRLVLRQSTQRGSDDVR